MAVAKAPQTTPLGSDSDAAEDSVDAQFGGDYSEASLEYVRSLGPRNTEVKRAYVPSSEPEEPLPDWCYDAAKQAVDEYVDALQDLKNLKPADEARAWIDYKRALVQGASPQEVTWMKLKAYHKLMDRVRAAAGLDAAGEAPQQRVVYGSGSSAAAQQRQSAAAAEPSTESEWAPGWDRVRYEPYVAAERREQLAALLAEIAGGDAARGGAASASAAAPASSLLPSAIAALLPRPAPGAAAAGGSGAATVSGSSPYMYIADYGDGRITEYVPEYVDELELVQQLKWQKRRVSAAFALSFALGLGACIARWLRRGRRPKSSSGSAVVPPLRP